MSMLSGKTYWLIGASEGLGRAVALSLDELGVRCVVSARNAERLQDLAGELKNDPLVVTCDVSDDASVATAWEKVQQEKQVLSKNEREQFIKIIFSGHRILQ